MKVKDKKNLNEQMCLKNLLTSKKHQAFKPKNINIQTINIDKLSSYKSSPNKKFSPKNHKKFILLNDNSINFNFTHDCLEYEEEEGSFFEYRGNNRFSSSIGSLNSSTDVFLSNKNRKHYKNRRRVKNSCFNNSIILNSSSSSSEENDISDSSIDSYSKREYRKQLYYEKMMAEDNDVDYLKRAEVGLASSEDEENNNNNNSLDNSILVEDNFNNEIERILIEIYNKNISLISSGKYKDTIKNKSDIEDIQMQIRKYLKKENFEINLLVLKCLSSKIKELVEKYKEKIFEIDVINNKRIEIQTKKRDLLTRQITHCNKSVGSNEATDSNSLFDSYLDDEDLNLYAQDELNGRGVASILLKELINIKNTLKVSSKEIEGIFKYPLSILRNANGQKIKFSVELMQCEEFCKTLLNDKYIYILLKQIKAFTIQMNVPKIGKYLEELYSNCEHKNEMTKFIQFINNKLNINQVKNENDEKIIENNNNKKEILQKQEIVNEDNKKEQAIEKGKKGKRKKHKHKRKESNDEEEKDEQEEKKFNDLDELLNYINDDKDSAKKGKKKGKKGKKNKKEKNCEVIEQKDRNNCIPENVKVEPLNFENLDEEFLKRFEEFKNDIVNNSIHNSQAKKIIPNLSNEFLSNIKID